jgi:nucleoside-diphosphate-sugar epimerase
MAGGNLFVTGATGHVGPAVCAALTSAGYEVTALVRRDVPVPGCRTVVGDLADLAEYGPAIVAADGIVHLASSRSLDLRPVLTDDIVGTAQLTEAWSHGPFVYASTSTVHGVVDRVIDATTPIDILDWYDMGKVTGEFMVRHAASESVERGPGVILRPTIYMGANERRNDRQYLSWFFEHCRAGYTFVFRSEEALERAGASYVGVKDFGSAVAASLDVTAGGAFPLAGGFTTFRELIDLINRTAGSSGRVAVRAEGAEASNEVNCANSRTELDSSAFVAATGWSPRQSLEGLVEEFVQAETMTSR